MKYRKLTKKEEEATLIQIMETLLDDSIPFSGAHRHKQWEKGWGENLKTGNLSPKYFGKHLIQRLNGKFIKAIDRHYEQEALYSILDPLAKKYLSKADVVIEFGCGTGHNLLRIRKFNKVATLIGGDWARSSQEIIERMDDPGILATHFDFFNPKFPVGKGNAVYTVAALEQVGTKYKKFVQHVLKGKPSIVVHIEPIPELLDPTKLPDYLSIQYMKKRKYLSGYLDCLRGMEKNGKLKIIEARRSGIGSLYIDGYSIIVWKPI